VQGKQKYGHPYGVSIFLSSQKGFESQIQAAGGSLVAASRMAAKHLFSAQQKMQTNPCCSAPPGGWQF